MLRPDSHTETKAHPDNTHQQPKTLKIDLKKMVSTPQQNFFLRKGHSQNPIFCTLTGVKIVSWKNDRRKKTPIAGGLKTDWSGFKL
jgi:hypothetical protein